MTSSETTIPLGFPRIYPIRDKYGSLVSLAQDIKTNGLRRPIALWSDGTLVSGARRLRAHFLLAAQRPDGAERYQRIPAVFVDTIEDSAKHLLADNGDTEGARPYTATEMCRLWDLLRQLDEPAARRRADEARRRGVELRRKTFAGERPPGRSTARGKSTEYVMATLAEPFGMSEVTASRLMTIYNVANNPGEPQPRRDQAAAALTAIDKGESSIWANYTRLVSGRSAPAPAPKPAAVAESAPAARQRAAWDRSLPQMEGLVAGLIELGPPNADLSWEQVGPVCTRLMAIRRELEKIIKKMKESDS